MHLTKCIPFYDLKIKKTQQTMNIRKFFNLIKGIHKKIRANIIYRGEILKALLLKVRIKTNILALITSTHNSLEGLDMAIGQEQEIKHI